MANELDKKSWPSKRNKQGRVLSIYPKPWSSYAIGFMLMFSKNINNREEF